MGVSGKLVETKSGDAVKGATIKVLERDIGTDDELVSGTTGDDGTFSINWTVRKADPWDYTAEIYVRFEGNNILRSSKSGQHNIKIR